MDEPTDATVADFLAHWGVKGMKWGVRKSDNPAGYKTPKGSELVLQHDFKSGDKLSIYKLRPGAVARLLSRVSKEYAEDVKNYPQFKFFNQNGIRVGEGAFVRDRDSLHLDWIGVKTRYRGRGYASAAMQGVLRYAQDQKIKKMTLEVPGNAPDARRIYEKMGFRSNGKDTPSAGPTDPWGGLFGMEMKVPQKRIKHSAEEDWEEQFAEEFAQLLIENFGEEGSMQQNDIVGDFLAHWGVKGMKWGVRKKRPVSDDAAAKQNVKDRVKKNKVASVSNADLQMAIRRMQLEQDFKRLKINEQSGVTRWLASALTEIGKREVQRELTKRLSVRAIKTVAKASVGAPG